MRNGLKLQRIVLRGSTRIITPGSVMIRKSGRLTMARDLWESIGSPERVGFLEADGVLCIIADAGPNSRKLSEKGVAPGLLSKPLAEWIKAQKIGSGGFPAEVHRGTGTGLPKLFHGKPMIYVYLTQEAWATYSDASTEKGGEVPIFPEV